MHAALPSPDRGGEGAFADAALGGAAAPGWASGATRSRARHPARLRHDRVAGTSRPCDQPGAIATPATGPADSHAAAPGLVQLIRLDRVPEFAAVNTAVELAKEIKRGAASGLVNALLRGFPAPRQARSTCRRSAAGSLGLAAHLAVAFSHPRWLVDRWLSRARRRGDRSRSWRPTSCAWRRLPCASTAGVPSLRRSSPAFAERGAAVHARCMRPTRWCSRAAVIRSRCPAIAKAGGRCREASQLVAAMLGFGRARACSTSAPRRAAKRRPRAERAGDAGARRRRRSAPHRVADRATSGGAVGPGVARAACRRARCCSLLIGLPMPCSSMRRARTRHAAPAPRNPLAPAQRRHRHTGSAPGRAARGGVGPRRARRGAGVCVHARSARPRTSTLSPPSSLASAFPHRRPAAVFCARRACALIDGRGFLQTFPHRHGLDGFSPPACEPWNTDLVTATTARTGAIGPPSGRLKRPPACVWSAREVRRRRLILAADFGRLADRCAFTQGTRDRTGSMST